MRLLLAAVVCCVLVAAVTDSDPNDLSERSGKPFARLWTGWGLQSSSSPIQLYLQIYGKNQLYSP